MHKHRLAAVRPLHLHKVALAEGGDRVAELLPAPALLRHLVSDTQPAIALETGGDEEASLTASRRPDCPKGWAWQQLSDPTAKLSVNDYVRIK